MTPRAASRAGRVDSPRVARFGLAAGAILVAVWPLALTAFRRADVYRVMGPFALAVIAVNVAFASAAGVKVVDRRRLGRDLAIGLACGAGMTALTYGAYAVGVRIIPGLAGRVTELYTASRSDEPGQAVAWTVVICIAEETLWRGWLLAPLSERIGRGAALAVSLATYAGAQSGSGSGIVVLAAGVCGAIWLAERALTGSLVAPLVSHLIWTPVVIHLVPLTLLNRR